MHFLIDSYVENNGRVIFHTVIWALVSQVNFLENVIKHRQTYWVSCKMALQEHAKAALFWASSLKYQAKGQWSSCNKAKAFRSFRLTPGDRNLERVCWKLQHQFVIIIQRYTQYLKRRSHYSHETHVTPPRSHAYLLQTRLWKHAVGRLMPCRRTRTHLQAAA